MNALARGRRLLLATRILLAWAFCAGGRVVAAAAADGGLGAGPAFAVAPDCARDGRHLQREPAAAFGKGVFLVAWSDGTRQLEQPTADIYCARIDAATGKALDPAGVRVCAAAGLQECPAVAFDGTNFLVAWQDLRGGADYDVYAARVDPAGKVLDPDGFPVAAGKANQARPAVAAAGGHFVVCWMDARQYPVYGLYAARVGPGGKVLDPDGRPLDAEPAEKVAKATPEGGTWLGDRNYWWKGLASRFQPCVASDGNACLVTYLRDVHSNQTAGWALLVNGADPSAGSGQALSVAAGPVKLPGEPKARVVPCRTADGWAVAMDHWVSGWSPTPRLAAMTLGPDLEPRQAIAGPPGAPKKGPAPPPPAPLLDLQKALAGGEREAGDYQQGKGHFAFWQTAAAWDGKQVVVATDYGWRVKGTQGKPAAVKFAVAATRVSADGSAFLDDPTAVLAVGDSADDTCVRHPALAAGPSGAVLLVYERDGGVDRLEVQARLLRP